MNLCFNFSTFAQLSLNFIWSNFLLWYQCHKDKYQRPDWVGYNEEEIARQRSQTKKFNPNNSADNRRFFEEQIEADCIAARDAKNTKQSWRCAEVGDLDPIYTQYRTYVIKNQKDGNDQAQSVVYPAYIFCKAVQSKYCYSFLSNLRNRCFM